MAQVYDAWGRPIDANQRIQVALSDEQLAGLADGLANSQTALAAAALGHVFNGASWDRLRGVSVIKSGSVTVTAGTPQTVWTPTTGKKFRALAWVLNGGTSSNAILKDNGTEFARAPAPVPGGGAGYQPWDFGNGYLSQAANNPLQIDIVSGTTVTIYYTIGGTEE